MSGFRGVYPAIITPMTANGELNEVAFREVMEFNIRAGVHGFWVAGGTGETHQNDLTLHFGLGQRSGPVSVNIRLSLIHI